MSMMSVCIRDIAMAIVSGDKWEEALKNKSGHATVKTPLRRLIKSMPGLHNLDYCITLNK